MANVEARNGYELAIQESLYLVYPAWPGSPSMLKPRVAKILVPGIDRKPGLSNQSKSKIKS
jgi:hypothetical protein